MKFDMNAAWNETLALIGANRELLLVLAGVFFLLPTVAQALVVPPVTLASIQTPEDFERIGQIALAQMAQYWWLYALSVIAQILGYLAILALLRDSTRPTVGSAIADGLRAVLTALGAYLLFCIGLSLAIVIVAVLGGLLGAVGAVLAVPLVLVGAVYLCVKVSLTAPVIALERIYNPFTALLRSWQLTRGNSLRLFVFWLLILISYVAIAAVLGLVIQGIAALLGPDAGPIAVALLGGTVGALATTVIIAALAATHRQLAGPPSGSFQGTFG